MEIERQRTLAAFFATINNGGQHHRHLMREHFYQRLSCRGPPLKQASGT
jgi:hypothetical protein